MFAFDGVWGSACVRWCDSEGLRLLRICGRAEWTCKQLIFRFAREYSYFLSMLRWNMLVVDWGHVCSSFSLCFLRYSFHFHSSSLQVFLLSLSVLFPTVYYSYSVPLEQHFSIVYLSLFCSLVCFHFYYEFFIIFIIYYFYYFYYFFIMKN